MSSLKVWRLVAVGVVLAILPSVLLAEEPKAQPPKTEKKSTDREVLDRRAKAALALAAGVAGVTSPVLAPAPRAKESKTDAPKKDAKVEPARGVGAAGCACGLACDCAEGKCPAGCPTAAAGSPPGPGAVYRDAYCVDQYGRWWKVSVPDPFAGGIPAPMPARAR